MSVVTPKYCVTMDSGVEGAIAVRLENNQEIKFTHCRHGLYYFDTTNASPVEMPQDKITNNKTINKYRRSVPGYSFVSTVAANKKYLPGAKLEE